MIMWLLCYCLLGRPETSGHWVDWLEMLNESTQNISIEFVDYFKRHSLIDLANIVQATLIKINILTYISTYLLKFRRWVISKRVPPMQHRQLTSIQEMPSQGHNALGWSFAGVENHQKPVHSFRSNHQYRILSLLIQDRTKFLFYSTSNHDRATSSSFSWFLLRVDRIEGAMIWFTS